MRQLVNCISGSIFFSQIPKRLIYLATTLSLIIFPASTILRAQVYILEETALDSEAISGEYDFPDARIPDVSHIDGTNNFVVAYPVYNSPGDLDAYFRIYDHNGNLVRGATWVNGPLKTDYKTNVGIGVDANSFAFAALYSLENDQCDNCTKLRTTIFDASGNVWCIGNVIDQAHNKAQDPASRAMIHDTYPIVFSAFNRVEWFTTEDLVRTDIDVMGSHSDFGRACLSPESFPVNSKYLLDPQDIEDDPEEKHKMDAANVAVNGNKILFVWTRPVEEEEAEVMGRFGDYIPSSKEVILGTEFRIGYGEPGGSVGTWSGVAGDPGSNRFLVAWDDPLDQIVGKFVQYDPDYVPPNPFLISQYTESAHPTDIAFLRSSVWVITWVADDPVSQTFEVWPVPL